MKYNLMTLNIYGMYNRTIITKTKWEFSEMAVKLKMCHQAKYVTLKCPRTDIWLK